MSVFPPLPVSTIDWTKPKNLKFQEVNGHIESTYHKATGKWTPLKFVSDPYLHIHGLAPGLNYGQQVFEGLKAFRMPGNPGGITLFRPDRNAMRLQHSSSVVNMPSVPVEMFVRACHAAVAFNADYVPPHESCWVMYCRPLLFASGPMFPPGVPDESPKGMGHAKAGGNYAGVLRWSGQAKTEGFDITLHLDSARHEEVDEFSLCGFLGVKRPSHGVGDDVGDDDDDVTLVVPDSQCAIESLTSDSVQHIARSWGWKVLAAGTAAGLIPIRSITRRGITGSRLTPSPRLLAESDEPQIITYLAVEQQGGGPVFRKLLSQFRAIQLGKVQDDFQWRSEVGAKHKELDSED